MSDDTDFAKTKDLLLKINEVVTQMDPGVRVSTFELLTSRFILKKPLERSKAPPGAKENGGGDASEASDSADLGNFISSFDTSKPHEALNILVAWLYSQRGAQPFSTSELKELADDCGLTIPNRPDMTFKGAKIGGKAIYAQSGKKNWKLTVPGELHVKSTYKVTKGSLVATEE